MQNSILTLGKGHLITKYVSAIITSSHDMDETRAYRDVIQFLIWSIKSSKANEDGLHIWWADLTGVEIYYKVPDKSVKNSQCPVLFHDCRTHCPTASISLITMRLIAHINSGCHAFVRNNKNLLSKLTREFCVEL